MGRKIFLLLLLLGLFFPASVFAATSEIKVTASVTPSPEWLALVKANSQVQKTNLTVLPFTLYTVRLFDGTIFLKHDSVLLSFPCSPKSSLSQTDENGSAEFLTPTFTPCIPEFTYLIGNQEVSLKTASNLLTNLSK